MSGRGVTSQALVRTIDRKPQELPLHRVDVSEIGRDEMIAAALIGHHLKMAPCESSRRTGAADISKETRMTRLWTSVSMQF